MGITIPSEREILALNQYQRDFSNKIAIPIKNIYEAGRLTPKLLAKRVIGVSESTWAGYRQPSYKHSRALHLCAILSWISGVSMNAFYFGNRMVNLYRDFNSSLVKLSVHCNQMEPHDFISFIERILALLRFSEVNYRYP